MKTKNLLYSKEFEDIYRSKEFKIEYTKLEFTEAIAEMMEFRGVTRKELGDKIGRTKKYMKKLMNGDIEITVNEYANILYALNFSFRIKLTTNEMERDEKWANLLKY